MRNSLIMLIPPRDRGRTINCILLPFTLHYWLLGEARVSKPVTNNRLFSPRDWVKGRLESLHGNWINK